MDPFFNIVWSLGVIIRNNLKRVGLLGPLESVLAYLGPRIIPPPSKEMTVALPFALEMTIPPGSPSARTYAAGRYETAVTNLFQSLLREGMTVVDLGAFCGYYTIHASRWVGTLGRVYAFEPHPRNYGYLLRNISANNLHNVIPVNKAVFDRTGSMALVLDKEPERNWLSAAPSTSASVNVPVVTLDDFFAEEGWPPIDILKMDIEGAEKGALEGMRELRLRNPRIQLIMEFDLANLRRAGTSREDLIATLQTLGFCSGFIIEQAMKPISVGQTFPQSNATYNLLLQKGPAY